MLDRPAVLDVHPRVRVVASERRDGSFNLDREPVVEVRRRARALVDVPWTLLDQRHTATVVRVESPGQHWGVTADAAVTTVRGAVLGVWVGDCVPVALWDDEGAVVGVAHAGWRGAAAGVIEATVDAVRSAGAVGPLRAVVGAHIHADAYAFGLPDLGVLVDRFGPEVATVTGAGTPALDMTAVVCGSLARLGVEVVGVGPCTATHGDRFWSWRARAEAGRQVLGIWAAP